MTCESESELLSFCAAQRADAWTQFDRVEKREMAAVCLFLAGVDWFGHEGGLRSAARNLLDGATASVSKLVIELKFDLPRFASRLKRKLNFPV